MTYRVLGLSALALAFEICPPKPPPKPVPSPTPVTPVTPTATAPSLTCCQCLNGSTKSGCDDNPTGDPACMIEQPETLSLETKACNCFCKAKSMTGARLPGSCASDGTCSTGGSTTTASSSSGGGGGGGGGSSVWDQRKGNPDWTNCGGSCGDPRTFLVSGLGDMVTCDGTGTDANRCHAAAGCSCNLFSADTDDPNDSWKYEKPAGKQTLKLPPKLYICGCVKKSH